MMFLLYFEIIHVELQFIIIMLRYYIFSLKKQVHLELQ